MYEEITEQSLSEIYSKFSNSSQKIANDVQSTYVSDDKEQRKFLQKQLAVTNSLLTHILKLRNLIASKDS
jgi:hypothetical protein